MEDGVVTVNRMVNRGGSPTQKVQESEADNLHRWLNNVQEDLSRGSLIVEAKDFHGRQSATILSLCFPASQQRSTPQTSLTDIKI